MYVILDPPFCLLSIFFYSYIYIYIYIQDGWTALIYAAWKGHSDIVEILLRNKADINIRANVSINTILLLLLLLLLLL